MRSGRRIIVVAPICALVLLTGCRDLGEDEVEVGYEPAQVEPIEGSELSRVILTEDAAQRIRLETATAAKEGKRTTVPESAVWVDLDGETWVYTNPEALEFVRAHVVVDHYRDGVAYLTKGIAPGTVVASVGVAELIGSELGI